MALTCEICASTEFVKQDGLFVCQGCGMKYSAEEVRRMITGETAVADNSFRVQNCLENARRARALKDWSHAGIYYQEAASLDAKNLEATLYSAYCRLMHTVMLENIAQREAATGILIRTISSVYSTFDPENLTTLLDFSRELGKDLLMMFQAPLEHNRQRKTHGGVLIKDLPKTDILFTNISQHYYQTIRALREKTGSKEAAVYLLQFCLGLHVTAKVIFSERMTVTANKMILAERQFVFTRYPEVITQYKMRKNQILADIQRYKTDLRDFPTYEEVAAGRREIDNLTRFLQEKRLTSVERDALRNQINNTRIRCARAEERLYAERNQRVASLQEEIRSINYLLGNY